MDQEAPQTEEVEQEAPQTEVKQEAPQTEATTGAAAAKRKRIAEGEAVGRVNPFKKQLACAEKQLRQQRDRGGDVNNLIQAQLKVQNMIERMEMWEASRRGEEFDLEKARRWSTKYFNEKFGADFVSRASASSSNTDAMYYSRGAGSLASSSSSNADASHGYSEFSSHGEWLHAHER